MATPTYESLVKQGRQAAKSQWVLGDLASKVETAYGEGKLQEYADDIGVEYPTLKDYRRVAVAYEKGERSTDLPWSVYRILAGQDDRAELVQDTALTASAARALVRARKELSATPDVPPIEEDTWLMRAVAQLRPVIKERTGIELPEQIRASIGWPRGSKHVGEAWSGAADGVPQIYVSPQLGNAERVLDVLTHEMLHVGLPKVKGHGKPFAAAAAKVGLAGPADETFAGPALMVVLRDIHEELGTYPHSPIEPPPAKKTPRSRETEPNTQTYVCVDCQSMDGDGEGYTCTVTVPRGLLSAGYGWPKVICPIDDRPMEIIDDE